MENDVSNLDLFLKKDMRKSNLVAFCLLTLISTVKFTYHVADAGIRTYLFGISTLTEKYMRQSALWTEQLPDSCPFYQEKTFLF